MTSFLGIGDSRWIAGVMGLAGLALAAAGGASAAEFTFGLTD